MAKTEFTRPEHYQPFFLADILTGRVSHETITPSDVRKEYSRLRKIAQARLKSFEGTEWVESATYRYNVGRFRKLSEIKTAGQLAYALSDIASFVYGPTTKTALKKDRAEKIAVMRSNGYTMVNEKNFNTFVSYMDDLRAAKIADLYDSEMVLEIAAATEKMRADSPEMGELHNKVTTLLMEKAKKAKTAKERRKLIRTTSKSILNTLKKWNTPNG